MLSLIVSDLNSKIKDLENERRSLITVIKLIQTDRHFGIAQQVLQPEAKSNQYPWTKQSSTKGYTGNKNKICCKSSCGIAASNQFMVWSSNHDDVDNGEDTLATTFREEINQTENGKNRIGKKTNAKDTRRKHTDRGRLTKPEHFNRNKLTQLTRHDQSKESAYKAKIAVKAKVDFKVV